jgi:hypothetical protein
MWSKAAVGFVAAAILAAPAGARDGGAVKVKVEVELRGVLSVGESKITLLVQESDFDPALLADVPKERTWVLDLGDAKELRKKAKELDGKEVVVKGGAVLLGVNTQTFRYKGAVPAVYPPIKPPDLIGSRSVPNLERRVEVKDLTEAPKE